jgi:hypothetical protein
MAIEALPVIAVRIARVLAWGDLSDGHPVGGEPAA